MDGWATLVVDAALTVHRALGPGFLESVYEEALAIELDARAVPFKRQLPFTVRYRDTPVGTGTLDLLVDDLLVVELKAVSNLLPIHHSQVVAYLKATGVPLALLLNFNVRYMRDGIRRIILSART